MDSALAAMTFGAMGLTGALYPDESYCPFGVWAYVLTGLICLPLAARRIAPMVVLVAVSAAYVVYVAAGYYPGLHLWGLVPAFYSVAAARPPQVTALGAVVFATALFVGGVGLSTPLPVIVAVVAMAVALAWGLGNVARQLDERNAQLTEATERLRREQEERVERVVTGERLRIARELHDVVAHHMSVISVQAGLAGYVFETDLPAVRVAVDTIGGTSREALEEMRRLLELLRVSELTRGTTEVDPTPRLAHLPALVERVRASGVEVDLGLIGELDTLPSGLQLTVFRIVQEAVTNMVKHASPCRAEIVVRREPVRLVATMRNETRVGSDDAAQPDGGGYGLVGMRERAKLYRGTLSSGVRSEGWYVVELIVPLP